jgi:hypothetical protein
MEGANSITCRWKWRAFGVSAVVQLRKVCQDMATTWKLPSRFGPFQTTVSGTGNDMRPEAHSERLPPPQKRLPTNPLQRKRFHCTEHGWPDSRRLPSNVNGSLSFRPPHSQPADIRSTTRDIVLSQPLFLPYHLAIFVLLLPRRNATNAGSRLGNPDPACCKRCCGPGSQNTVPLLWRGPETGGSNIRPHSWRVRPLQLQLGHREALPRQRLRPHLPNQGWPPRRQRPYLAELALCRVGHL